MSINLLLTLFLANCIISIIISGFLCLFVEKKAFWLLVVIAFFIPIAGWVLDLLLIVLYKYFQEADTNSEVDVLKISNYINEKNPNIKIYSEGWAATRLMHNSFLKTERIQALNIINRNFSSEVNKLNNLLLFDDCDEIRLYAFSLLEKQRDHYNEKIYSLLKLYKNMSPDSEGISILEKRIAKLYWEIFNLRLVEIELAEIIIQKCLSFTEKALKKLKDDPELWCLLGHLYFQKSLFSEALEALLYAEQKKAPITQTIPLVSEYYFNKKDYINVKNHLSAEQSLWVIPNFNKIVQFWCEKNE